VHVVVEYCINHIEPSDWQLSKLYMWDTHLSDSDFTRVARSLHGELFTKTLSNGVCLACQSNSQSHAGASVCGCNPGYTARDGWICVKCAFNTFKNQVGNNACSRCPSAYMHSEPGATVCTCLLGYIKTITGGCIPVLVVACSFGHTSVNGECAECSIGKYKNTESKETCTLCPHNTTTLTSGSITLNNCVCQPGHSRDSEMVCKSCLIGKFKSMPGG